MKESVAIAKEANTKKDFSSTQSDNSIHRVPREPERQLGSLRTVMGNIRRNGGTPSVDSISTELSNMPVAQRAHALLALQQTHGNRYVQRVVAGIQAKLVVGQPGDKYEQEADRVADAVMRMPEPRVRQPVEEEKEGSMQTPFAEQISPLVRRQIELEEEETLLSKEIPGQTSEVNPDLESAINSLKGGGQPLPGSSRAFFEPLFNRDFSRVRIVADNQGAKAARSIHARAFTMGNTIAFGQGQYSPGTPAGQRLLAHELTHVVQQGNIATQARGSLIQCYGFDQTSPSDDRLRVDTEAEDPSGQVRPHASATIISDQQDSIPFNIRVNTARGHRPVRVIMEIRQMTSGSTRILGRRDLGDIHFRSGSFFIPQRGPGAIPPGTVTTFYIVMTPSAGEEIQYSHQLTYNEPAVRLARALNGEGGSTHQDMMALIHEVNNRMDESRLMPGQVDLSHPTWQENFIATTYLLGGGASVAIPSSWRTPPTSAARIVAQQVLNAGSVIGTDPTNGALFHYTTPTRLSPTGRSDGSLFDEISWQVAQRMLAPVELTNNTFYGCGPRAHTGTVRTKCRRP
jgi:hypothetical protein